MGSVHTYDVAIIGGGASGLAAAITAARCGARTVVIERDVACGLPILATGNGRCNLSNECLDSIHYRHPKAVRAVFGAQPEQELDRFFDSLGIVTRSEHGRLYPHSRRAESVRDALMRSCERAGVAAKCATEPVEASWDSDRRHWDLTVSEPIGNLHGKPRADFRTDLRARRKELAGIDRRHALLSARAVIIACGGPSKTVADIFHLPHRPESPVLCPVACHVPHVADALDPLDGLRIETRITLRRCGNDIWSEQGEILFRPYGISGIAAFNISRRARRGDELVVEPFSGIVATDEEFTTFVRARSQTLSFSWRADETWFDGLLARPLARLMLKTAQNGSLARTFSLLVDGTADERAAQVQRGGIPLSAVKLPSLVCADATSPHLFVCGEALDIDADCGGYNLAWAWLSGIHAAQSAWSALNSHLI